MRTVGRFIPMRAILTASLLGLAPLLALGLGACTPVQWEHPDYGTSRLQADLADCDHAAFEESWRTSWQPAFVAPHVYTLPNGQRVFDPGPQFPYMPYADTSELRSFCMRAKGYRLVPVPSS